MARIDDIREIAEKVMGWRVTFFRGGHGTIWKHDWLMFNEGAPNYRKYAEDPPISRESGDVWFDPFTDANAALEVVEAMRKRGLQFSCMNWTDGRFTVAFNSFTGSPLEPATLCEAICAAALAAKRSEAANGSH